MTTIVRVKLEKKLYLQLQRNITGLLKDETTVEEWSANIIEYMAWMLHHTNGEVCRDPTSTMYGKKFPFASKTWRNYNG